MTEYSPQIIFKEESFLNEEIELDEQDPIYTNEIQGKCGEIILMTNTKFVFLCTFCDERFQNIRVFQKHIKCVHITNTQNSRRAEVLNPLYLHPNEESIVQLDIEKNDYKTTDNEYKLNIDVDKEDLSDEVKDMVIINRSDDIEIEELRPTQNSKIKGSNKDFKTKEVSRSSICSAIKDLDLHSDKKVYSCCYCQHIACDQIILKAHMQSTHSSRTQFQCEECGKCFRDRSNLRCHMVIHSGARPYKCEFCDAGFSHSNSLKAHRYLHTGNRPYKCVQCDKGFVSSGALKIHMREHTGETPYVCQICEKAFSTQCSHKKHMISHSGYRAYKCTQCGKDFIHKETLANHMICHSTERNFVCDVCQKKFNHKKNLAQHKKLHSNIKQYNCKVCNKDFAQYAGLYSHMKYHKNKE